MLEKYEVVAFDWDDTLGDLHSRFVVNIKKTVDTFCSLHPECSRPIVDHLFRHSDLMLIKAVGINPERVWDIADIFSAHFNNKDYRESMEYATRHFYETFWEVPPLLPRAKETVVKISSLGKRIAVVTHANQDWAKAKVNCSGFSDKIDHLIAVPVSRKKDADAWRGVLEHFNVSANKVLIVGDSIKSDIEPGLELGCDVVHIHSNWNNILGGQLPVGVRQIRSVAELLE